MVKQQKKSEVSFNPFLVKLFIIWLVAITIGLLIAVINLKIIKTKRISSLNDQKPNQTNIIPTPPPARGYFRLMTNSGSKIYLPKKPIEIILVAGSDQQLVSGYDVVLEYNSDNLRFDSVDNQIASLDLKITDDSPGKLAITSVKKSDSGENLIFDNTILTVFTFTPIKEGKFEVNFNFKLGETNDSNLVSLTVSADDLLGKADNFSGYAGKIIKITKNKKTIAPGNIIASIDNIEAPTGVCNDCVIKFAMNVEQDDQQLQLKFESGGFTGKTFEAQEAFGYLLEPAEYNQEEVMMKISKL